MVGEIGVLRGAFARSIRDTAEPDTLHLIDPWEGTEKRKYTSEKMNEAYQDVQNGFRDDIGTGRVVLHRTYSTEAAATFPDHYFDWVYIDAMHDYVSVRADLLAFAPKVKPDGFILGHDFSTYKPKFGVIPAVREFTRSAGFDLALVTNETNPTYLLARSNNDTTLTALRTALLNHEGGQPIELDESLFDHLTQVEASLGNGQTGRLMKFGPCPNGELDVDDLGAAPIYYGGRRDGSRRARKRTTSPRADRKRDRTGPS